MTLGERCDEIVRLIDETLSDVAADASTGDPRATASLSARPAGAARPTTVAPPRWPHGGD